MGKIFIPGIQGLDKIPRANGCDLNIIKSKQEIFDYLVEDKFARTRKMFKYENYPETFDPNCFERALQSQGFCIVKKIAEEDMRVEHSTGDFQEGEPKKYPAGVYALLGVGLGGLFNPSYIPTYAIGENPYLGVSINSRIDEECVNVWNDSKMLGLAKLNSFYGALLADAYITLRLMLVLNRAPSFISASSEDEKTDALDYLSDLDEGKLGVIGTSITFNNLLGGDSLGTHRMSGDSHNQLKDCLETIQYLNGQWNIALGLNDNYNMKREALNQAETEANFDTLFPRIDDMLKCREKGIEEINRMFGLNIKVSLDGAWARLSKREETAEKTEEAQAEILENKAEEQPEEPSENENKPEQSEEGKEDGANEN